MKILHVLKSSIFSGAENVATSIIKAMPEGYEAVYLCAIGPIETKLLEMDITYIAVKEVTVDVIKKAIEEEKPDIIHAHDFGCGLMCAKATDTVPIISHLHSNPNWIRKIDPRSITYGGACKSFTKIITVSEAVEKEAWFRDKMAGKTLCLGNPFDARAIFEKGYLAGTDLAKEKLETYKSDLLFCGRLVDAKNPLEFINIVAEVKEKLPNVKAIMVGSGELGGKCLKLIEKRGLAENIKMVGFQSNPYLYMNQTKVLVMPSVFEGFGLAALEAMTFSKPVLSSCVGGVKEIVNDECGCVCGNEKKPIDREAFVTCASELLEVEEIYSRKAEGARKRAQYYDNFSEYMQSVKDIYDEVVSSN